LSGSGLLDGLLQFSGFAEDGVSNGFKLISSDAGDSRRRILFDHLVESLFHALSNISDPLLDLLFDGVPDLSLSHLGQDGSDEAVLGFDDADLQFVDVELDFGEGKGWFGAKEVFDSEIDPQISTLSSNVDVGNSCVFDRRE